MIPNRIVLDTNVCLDLFVFGDPRWLALLDALRSGCLEAVTRADCRNEWLLVLRYEHLKLDDAGRARAISEFDALIRCIDRPEELRAAISQPSPGAVQSIESGTATPALPPLPCPFAATRTTRNFWKRPVTLRRKA
jgi:hypothetical protein